MTIISTNLPLCHYLSEFQLNKTRPSVPIAQKIRHSHATPPMGPKLIITPPPLPSMKQGLTRTAFLDLSPKAMKKVLECLPFNAQEDTGVPFHRNFNSILRRDHQRKKIPMSVAPMSR